MKERYENWKELEPLTAPVPVGTKCVVVGRDDLSGLIVTTLDEDRLTKCALGHGTHKHFRFSYLALLPSEEPAKVERKIVNLYPVFGNGRVATFALCNDGSVWFKKSGKAWFRLPPIPQDAV